MRPNTKRSHRENTVGPWARQKLDALESYLIAYQNVMTNQRFRTVFVDAFAGSGHYELRSGPEPSDHEVSLIEEDDVQQQREFIDGSPRRALGLEKKFFAYRFIDLDPERVRKLDALGAQFEVSNFKAIQGDANLEVQKIAANFGAGDLRGVAFLDPYGAHLHWKTVAALAATKKFDVIINCPIHMAIDRLVVRTGDVPSNWAQQLDNFFGTREWYDVSFSSRDDLFSSGQRAKRDDAAKRQLDLYVHRLRSVFRNVSKPSLVRNSRGLPLYYLIWAGENGRGAPIAEHILNLGSKVVVPARRRTSSDTTDK